MHRLDEAALEAVAVALRVQRSQSAADTLRLHQAEKWREELVADDARLGDWLAGFPGTDAQQLRALIRQARKDAREPVPGGSARQGRAYREIFNLVRTALAGTGGPGATPGPSGPPDSLDQPD
jgi:ribosome-associated protein